MFFLGPEDKLLRRGQNFLHKGEWKKALTNFEDLLQLSQKSPFYFMYKSLALSNLNQFEEAIQTMNKGLELPQTNSLLHLFKGMIYFDHSQYKLARESLEQVEDKNHLKKPLLFLNEFQEKKFDTQIALQEIYETFLSYYSSSYDIQARALYLLEKELNADHTQRASLRHSEPSFRPLFNRKKRLLKATNKTSSALNKLIDDTSKKDSKGDIIKALNKCESLLSNGLVIEEIVRFQTKLYKKLALYYQDNTDEALKEFNLFLEALYQCGDYKSTISFCNQLITTNPTINEYQNNHIIQEFLAYALLVQNQHSLALENFQKARTGQSHNKSFNFYASAICNLHIDQRADSFHCFKASIDAELGAYQAAIRIGFKTLYPSLNLYV